MAFRGKRPPPTFGRSDSRGTRSARTQALARRSSVTRCAPLTGRTSVARCQTVAQCPSFPGCPALTCLRSAPRRSASRDPFPFRQASRFPLWWQGIPASMASQRGRPTSASPGRQGAVPGVQSPPAANGHTSDSLSHPTSIRQGRQSSLFRITPGKSSFNGLLRRWRSASASRFGIRPPEMGCIRRGTSSGWPT